MSKRNLASPEPDQPSKRRLVQGPLATSTQYHILKGKRLSIPSELGRRILARCTLEILDVGSVDIQNTADPNRNNHCILRLTFAAPTTEATRHAPIGTRGLILDQVPDDQRDTTTTCEFHMKTFRYEGPHEDALKTIDLPIRGKQGARCFLRVLRKANLVPCEFDSTDDFMYGCRDFM